MSGLSERDVERLAEVLRENRNRDYKASVCTFTPEKMARAVLASDWLAERDAAIRDEAKAEAWDEAIEAVAWCLDNGESSAAAALAYTHKNNPHRALLDGGDQ